MEIREVKPSDEAAIMEICFRTFGDGSDDRYEHLAGLRWAVPYIRWETPHCFAAVDETNRPAGYVLSSPDSLPFMRAFHRRMRREISAELKLKRPRFGRREFRKVRFRKLYYFDSLPRWIAREYPAHLHIDILPEYQGMGLGKELMDRLLNHLREEGCAGIHLGVGPENDGAIRFYRRAGFEILHESKKKPVTFMGLRLNT